MSYTGQSDPSSLSRLRDDLLLERYVCSFPNVELRAVPGQKRRGLFATAPIARNAAILVESACCWQEGGPSGALYAPLHTPDELDGLLYQLSPFYASPGDAAPPAPLPRAELAARVMRENSFGIGAPSEDSQAAGGAYGQGSQGRAVYLAVSMCNHSCQPSARASQEGGALALQEDAPLPRRVLEARRDIAAGEEVTISYVPVTWMRAPRAAVLQASWGFQCQCQRCTAPRDDTIVRKPRQGEGGVEGGGALQLQQAAEAARRQRRQRRAGAVGWWRPCARQASPGSCSAGWSTMRPTSCRM